MRKLSLLVIAILFTRYGFIILSESEPLAAYALRDGLILCGLGLLLFVAQASGWPIAPGERVLRHWPLIGRFLAALGVGLTLAAAVWAGIGNLDAAEATGPRQAVLGLWTVGILAYWVGILWPSPPAAVRPRYRWELDAAGRYVRRILHGSAPNAPGPRWTRGSRTALLVVVGVTLAVAVGLRFGQLADLPVSCIGAECERALELAEGMMEAESGARGWSPQGLKALTSELFFRLTGDGLLSLRLAAALYGIILLPIVYGLARLYTRAGGAAVAVIFLALSPWHLWVGRLSHEWIAVPVFVTWTLWTASRALRGQSVVWWSAVGLGGLFIEAPALGFVPWMWALLLCIVGGLGAWQVGLSMPAILLRWGVLAASFLTVALPGLAWQGIATWQFGPGEIRHTLAELATALIRPAVSAAEAPFPGAPLPPLVAALTLLGVGYLARHAMRLPALLLLSSLALWIIGVLGLDWIELEPAGALLPLLPFVFVCVAIASDRLLDGFQITWQPLIPAPRALAGGLALALILAFWRVPSVIDALGQADQGVASSADVAMGQYLARCLNQPETTLCNHLPDDAPPLVFVPRSVLDSPGTRLLAGAGLEAGRVRGLDATRDLLPDAPVDRARVYFVPLENQLLLDLIQQFYPDADATAPASDAGPTLFAVFRVSPALIVERQGLQGAYAQGESFVMASEADLVRRDGPLGFAWSSDPPLPPPFTVAWEGSLAVPIAGMYEFAAEATGELPPLTLQLDDRLVLDTSLDLTSQRIPLAQGPYRLRLYVRVSSDHTATPDLRVRWRLPGGEFEDIPRHALYSPPLPQIGLLGTYYAGSQWQGPTLTQRKDLILEPATDLPPPYSVRWEGKLAASRAGEYLFAVSGEGLTQILVDGRFLLDYAPNRDASADAGFAQAGIYLTRGWRHIEIRHAPSAARSNLRILWQPPGSGPELLRSRYLLPITTEVYPSDVALPPLPELWDARLGDDTFALSYLMEMVEREVALPPAALPALPLEDVWRFARCGSGADQLNAPHGVALDVAAGRVYVADTGNRRVTAFGLVDGAPLAVFDDERFEEPTDVALWPGDRATPGRGQVFVLDAVGHPIFRLDPESGAVVELSLETGFYRPRGFAVDENGVFWVADTGGARVAALAPDGELLTQMGGHGTLLGQGQPVDTLAVSGVRWTVTAEDGRLWHLDTLGSIPAIQRVNTVDGPHLAGLPDGGFFLTDPASRSFVQHAPSGEPVGRFAYADALVHPTGIAAAQVDDVIMVAVADSGACGLSLWRMSVGP